MGHRISQYKVNRARKALLTLLTADDFFEHFDMEERTLLANAADTLTRQGLPVLWRRRR